MFNKKIIFSTLFTALLLADAVPVIAATQQVTSPAHVEAVYDNLLGKIKPNTAAIDALETKVGSEDIKSGRTISNQVNINTDGVTYLDANKMNNVTRIDGLGNVITSAKVENNNLILEKGITVIDQATLDAELEGKMSSELASYDNTKLSTETADVVTGATVNSDEELVLQKGFTAVSKAYVDAKTTGIVTDANLTELENRVTVNENKIGKNETISTGETITTQVNENTKNVETNTEMLTKVPVPTGDCTSPSAFCVLAYDTGSSLNKYVWVNLSQNPTNP